jgi:ankyrin repeat protein
LDKDGSTALSIACKEGFQEIASALINSGAYLNSQDRNGDTPLINAGNVTVFIGESFSELKNGILSQLESN